MSRWAVHIGFSLMVRLWGWESWGRDQELDSFDCETPLEWFSTEGLGYVGGWEGSGCHDDRTMAGVQWKGPGDGMCPTGKTQRIALLQMLVAPSWETCTLRNIQGPYEPAIPLWPYILNKTVIQKRYMYIFIGALFTLAKTWKQPKCLSRDEWIKRCGMYVCICAYIHTYMHTHTHTHTHTQWNTTRS